MTIIPPATCPVPAFCRSGAGPGFKVRLKGVVTWGVQALARAARGLSCTTAVRIGCGDGITANPDWQETLGQQWRQYEAIFPPPTKLSKPWSKIRPGRVPAVFDAFLTSSPMI